MSNRYRRNVLKGWRGRAIVLFAGECSPDGIDNLKDWNRWERSSFRSIRRSPLRCESSIRWDAGLATIQDRNAPPQYNPLRDDPPGCPQYFDRCDIWHDACDAIWAAMDLLTPKRVERRRFDWTSLSGHRFDARPHLPHSRPEKDPARLWLEQITDYPARFHLAFEKLRVGNMAVHQYGQQMDFGEAVRHVLSVDHRITDPELYALLALAECWWALDGLSIQHPDHEFCADLVRYGERFLAEARRLKEVDAIDLAWRKDSHNAASIKGGSAPKTSKGILMLAANLQDEMPTASASHLFNVALVRCKAGLPCGDYVVVATPDEVLTSTHRNGGRDGGQVSLSAWRKNYLRRKR